jgi:hypothetical protein
MTNLLEHLQAWTEENASGLSAKGVHLSLTHGPAERDKKSAWVDVESSTRSVRLVVWGSGEADLSVGDVAAGAVIADEHLEISSRFGLEQALRSAVAWAADESADP